MRSITFRELFEQMIGVFFVLARAQNFMVLENGRFFAFSAEKNIIINNTPYY
jgi:hypothetical protein